MEGYLVTVRVYIDNEVCVLEVMEDYNVNVTVVDNFSVINHSV